MTSKLPNRPEEVFAGKSPPMSRKFVELSRFTTRVDGRRREFALMRCPHKDCAGEFAVRPKVWRSSKLWHGLTRPCPNCFKVSLIP